MRAFDKYWEITENLRQQPVQIAKMKESVADAVFFFSLSNCIRCASQLKAMS